MAEDDIAAGGFRSYFGGLVYLERACSWDRRTAHAELMDAVNDGRVRRKGDLNPPQPRYDSGDWNEHNWHTLASPASMDHQGNWTHYYPDHDGKPAFTKEEYSTADIERLADEELSRRARRNPGGLEAGKQERPGPAHQGQSADGSAGRGFLSADAKLVEEMHQLITSGKARNPWDAANTLAAKAEGSGALESKARRLAQRYTVSKRMNS